MKAEAITSRARSGAFWSLVIAGIFAPVPYVRNWLFSAIDPTGAVAGSYFMVLLLLQAVQSLFFPGGRNVLPAFFPKLTNDQERSRFVTGSLYAVLVGAGVGMLVIAVWPGVVELVLQEDIDSDARIAVCVILPIILLASFATSLLMAHGVFTLSSFLLRSQLIVMTTMAGVVYLTGSQVLQDAPAVWFGGAIAAAASINFAVAAVVLSRRITWTARGFFPPGSVRFAAMAHLDTVMVFAYGAIDRLFIAAYFGFEKLGTYFLLLTIAQLIPRIAQELGHLILATFSKLRGAREEDRLARGYHEVARLTASACAALSLPIILFSKPIASVFGPACAADHRWLIFLAVAINVDSLHTINGMTLMAYGRMHRVLLSKFVQNVVQLTLTGILISRFEVVGVIVALGIGHAARSLSLIWSVRGLKTDGRLLPPRVYYISQVLVLVAAVVAYQQDGMGLLIAFASTVAFGVVLWFAGGLRKDDLYRLIPRRKAKDGGTP
jgi:O-antigen/teichoic acid export membrane protein